MKTANEFNLTPEERRHRRFSEAFKRKKVKEIESGKTRPADVQKEYQVSATSVYRWINKYGQAAQKGSKVRLVLEEESDTKKLRQKSEELNRAYRTIGEKQVEIDYLKRLIEMAEEHYGIEIKKNSST